MALLSPIWSVLSLASGRIDPWPMLDRSGGCEALTRGGRATWLQAGIPLDLVARACEESGLECEVSFLLAGGQDYPASLTQLPFAPPVLFYQGSLDALRRPAVAIVGSRRCSAEGRRSAGELARAVTLAGGTVISGMAIGIDTAAHREAMRHGPTVAVLGQGLAVPLSYGAERMRQDILDSGGLILSELLPDLPAKRFTFLSRNRIIAGLARATVVVEAGARSGALSTARHALEAGREVLAVPGHYRQETAAGCLTIIEQGASIVRAPSTVVQAAGLGAWTVPEERGCLPASARLLEDALQRGGTVEQLAVRAGISVVQACSLLMELELAGLVRRLPGQRYERA